jgi:response regulator RpfG family c-di-GMP phosphodiesterase
MTEKVIYVDDDVGNLKAVARVFRREPFEFVTFDSPVTALNEIKELRPSVIISDLCMPEMSGIEFLAQAKLDLPETVGIILTGHADLASAMDAINKNHLFGYIQKPWNDDELKGLIRSALEHRHSIFWLNGLPDSIADELMQDPKGNRAIRKLTDAVCHELSQPIMIIAGYVHLLQDLVADDDLTRLYLSNISLKLNTLEELKNKVDTLSKRIAAKACIDHVPS